MPEIEVSQTPAMALPRSLATGDFSPPSPPSSNMDRPISDQQLRLEDTPSMVFLLKSPSVLS
jgi:hypothetical protein